jgi:hypothetical protein
MAILFVLVYMSACYHIAAGRRSSHHVQSEEHFPLHAQLAHIHCPHAYTTLTHTQLSHTSRSERKRGKMADWLIRCRPNAAAC